MELTVWCGARKGRRVTNMPPPFSRPATEWMRETSSASSTVIGGRMEGRRRASMVLPEPGEPIISRLCPPATATSIAVLTDSCPFTSAKSSPPSRSDSTRSARSVKQGSMTTSPARYCAASRSVRTGMTSMPATTLASTTFPSGTSTARLPMRFISRTIGRIPFTRRTSPDSASSPTSAYSASSSVRRRCVAFRRQIAIGRS